MNDDEIESEHKKIIDHFTGVTTALIQVIQGLQAQPGFDHQRFLANLAVYQVSGEQPETSVPAVFHKAHQDTLASFSKTPVQVPPLASKFGRGPSSP